MRKLSDEQWQSLASAMAREMARVGPHWTDHNVHDPGITVLEILAYALTDLQYRRSTLTASGRALAQRIAQLAGSLAAVSAADDCPPGMQRVNYFSGQLLSAEDFNAEQDYVRATRYRLNRLLHGAGVVSGLRATLERAGGSTRVVIAPGLAFDRHGREIELSAPASLPLPAQGKALLVLLQYAEQPCRPVRTLAEEPDAQTAFTRITETFTATLAPVSDDNDVALARATFTRGRWAFDRKFKAAKIRG